MRLVHGLICAVAVALVAPTVIAQDMGDKDRKVAGGGIKAAGWTARLDAAGVAKGMKIEDSKFVQAGQDFVLNIGPAATYWNPTNVAKGDYTLKATLKNLKSNAGHPHSAGIFIGGQNMEDGTKQAYTYCVVFTNGAALVRQFNGQAVSLIFGGNRPANVLPAVKPEGPDGATNEISWTVKGGIATCSVNGTAIATVDAGKMPSTDGVYGIRATHNVDLTVTGFGLVK